MLAASRRIVHLGLCIAAMGATASAADGYRVILRDGSYISAAEKPVVEGGIAKVRLAGGLFTSIPEGKIDWRRSDSASGEGMFTTSRAAASPRPAGAARPAASGVFTLIGEPAPAPATGAGEAPVGTPEAGAAAAPDPRAEIRERISALNTELDALQQTKLDLEDRIRQTIQLEEIPALRRQADQVDAEIKRKRGELSALILQETGAPRP